MRVTPAVKIVLDGFLPGEKQGLAALLKNQALRDEQRETLKELTGMDFTDKLFVQEIADRLAEKG